VPFDPDRIERIVETLIAASRGDYDRPIQLEENDDALLEVELGINYLLDELLERRAENEHQRESLLEQSRQLATQTAALVEALSTPIIVVWPGVLALPLIGRIDRQRANSINVALLERVVSERASHVILDLTGVETIEASTMDALMQMIRAIGLLGGRCLVTGIRPATAQHFVAASSETGQIKSYARVSDALAHVLAEKPTPRAPR
jgi:rsbT co-antagonist protein RsbR